MSSSRCKEGASPLPTQKKVDLKKVAVGDLRIVHNWYFDGKVQSVGFADEDQVLLTIGAFLPGTHHFERAKLLEVFYFTTGRAIVNGVEYTSESTEPVVVQPGCEITIKVIEPSTHVCYYGKAAKEAIS